MTTASNTALWTLTDVRLPGRRQPRLAIERFSIEPGVTAVLGASGAGKTSLLNLLVGFEVPQSGRVERDPSLTGDVPVFWGPPDHGLWLHLSVREHLTAVAPTPVPSPPSEGERVRGRDGATGPLTPALSPADGGEGVMLVDSLLAAVGLHELAHAEPATLSLGERSRLVLARALASRARVLVLDEPLAHVDAAWRGRCLELLRHFAAQPEHSLVVATHQPEVALGLADHILSLDAGCVIAHGSPQTLYDDPPNRTVAELLGPVNWFDDGDRAQWWPDLSRSAVRPEHLALEADESSPIVVETTRSVGGWDHVALLQSESRQRRTVQQRSAARPHPPGTHVRLSWIAAVMVCLLLPGCFGGAGPTLPVVKDSYWSLPPEGSKAPAPRSVTAGPDGEYYVLDNAGRVLVLDANGRCTKSWWMPEHSVGKPERLLVCRDGRLAVADTHYHRVVFFSKAGEVLGMFGRKGEGPGEFIYPVAIAEDDRHNLYVCEYGGHDRVQKFQADGTYLAEFGGFGTEPGKFQRPSGILWHDGRLYVADAFNNRLHVFRDDGQLVETFQSDPSAELHYPYDVARGPTGDLFVVEYGGGRVTRLSADGKLLGRFGTTGGGPQQFAQPWGLAVDAQGAVLVADTGNRRIVKLELSR